MAALLILSSATFVLALFLGTLVLRSDPESPVNRLFFVMTITIALWSVGAMLSYTTVDRTMMQVLFKTNVICVGLYAAFLLHFTLEITQIHSLCPGMVRYLLYLPIAVLSIFIMVEQQYFESFERVGNFWHYNHRYTSPLLIVFMLYWTAYMGWSLTLLFRGRLRARSGILRHQFGILAAALAVSAGLSLIKALVLPQVFDFESRGGTLSFQLIWLFSIVFLVDRYRFLLPYQDAERVAMMEVSGYSIIIIDRQGRIRFMNREAERLLGVRFNRVESRSIQEFIHPLGSFLAEIMELDCHSAGSFACTMEVLSKDAGKVAVDTKVTALKDKLERCSTFLIMLQEREPVVRLRQRFTLSVREAEVVQFMVNGFSNREIAEAMYISERTVKTHVSHILRKLGVDNRVRAVLLLRDLGLISKQPADKNSILL